MWRRCSSVPPARLLALACCAGAALDLAAAAPPPPPIGRLLCTTQDHLFQNLNDMKGICCDQLGEAAIPWGDDPFPITCLSRECQRTVLRVWSGCGALLNSSGFFDEWRVQLQQTVELCQQEAPPLPVPGMEYVILDRLPGTGSLPLDSCPNATSLEHRTLVSATIPDPSAAPPPPSSVPAIDLRAPPGFVVTLTFNALWLPVGVALAIREGTTATAGREIASLSGTQVPTQRISSTTSNMHVALQSSGLSGGSTRLIALAAELSCRCVEAGSCGPHGTCNQLLGCICTGGFLGARCDDASCM
jgi:hypothetical protein